MRTIISITLYFLLGCSGIQAQSLLSSSRFLETFNSQEEVVFQNIRNEFRNTHSYEIPVIKKLQFRTEMNGFDIQKQEYLLRANINSSKKINKQSQYQASISNTAKMEMIFAKTKALKERYDILVNLIGLTSILEVKKQLNILYQDRIMLYQKSISFPNFDILDLIEAEDAQQKNEHNILDLESDILLYQQYVQQLLRSETIFHLMPDQLIGIDKIKELLLSIDSEITTHPQLNVLNSEIQERLLAYDLEQVKSKFSLNYIQARFADDPKDDIHQKIAVGVGFDIPLKNSDRLDFNELQLDILESQSVYEYTTQKLINNQNMFLVQLQNQIQKYDLIHMQLSQNSAVFALEKYREFSEASPVVLLKLRESTLVKELLLQETKFKLFQSYVNYLDVKGVLGQQPYKNYLTQTLEHF